MLIKLLNNELERIQRTQLCPVVECLRYHLALRDQYNNEHS